MRRREVLGGGRGAGWGRGRAPRGAGARGRPGWGIPRGVRAGGEVVGVGGAPQRGRREERPGCKEMRRQGRAPGEGARGGGRGWAGRLALGRGSELVGLVVGAARGAGGDGGRALHAARCFRPG